MGQGLGLIMNVYCGPESKQIGIFLHEQKCCQVAGAALRLWRSGF